MSRRKLARPGAGGVIETSSVAVELGGPVQRAGIRGMGGEQGVELLPVGEEGGGPHLTKAGVSLGSVRVGEQGAQDVGGVVLASVGDVAGIAGVNVRVALDGVTHSRVQLGDGGKLDPLGLDIVG